MLCFNWLRLLCLLRPYLHSLFGGKVLVIVFQVEGEPPVVPFSNPNSGQNFDGGLGEGPM
jgi:hypothetical protein